VAQRFFSCFWVLSPSIALSVAACALIGYLLDRPSQPGVTVPEAVRDLGDRPAGSEFAVTISVRNDGNRRCRIIGVGGDC
jgi:hypothetical protein